MKPAITMGATPPNSRSRLIRLPLEVIAPGLHALRPEAATYATRVHRLGPGDPLVVFDPDRAVEADAEIAEVSRRAVTVRVGDVRPARLRPARAVTLIQGVGKGDKLDAIVRDATELGVTAIVPAIGERSVARPDAARGARWRRIAVEAARQCGRGDAPAIAAPVRFTDAVRDAGVHPAPGLRSAEPSSAPGPAEALRLCLDPAADQPLGVVLASLAAQAVTFAVGPEGGLTTAEVGAAEAAGFTRVTLGPLVLRTETVCAAVLGALLGRGA